MYQSFRVKNFRCFKDLQINDLGRVNLIAGKNNTGKTALMEAMYLHTRPNDPLMLQNMQNVRDLEMPSQDLPSFWSQFFVGLDSSIDIQIEGENDQYSHSLTVFEASRRNDEYIHHFDFCTAALMNTGITQDEAEEKSRFVEATVALHYRAEPNEQRFSYLYSNGAHYSNWEIDIESNFIPVQGRPTKDIAVVQYSKLVRDGRLPTLIRALNALEPRLVDLRLLKTSGEEMIWGDVDSLYIPLKLMGEGINRICHFIVTLMSYPKGYVFIDEIENGIHYSVQKEFWKAIGQVARDPDLDIQVFATTHSYEMIEAAHEAFKDDDPYEFRFHRLNRNSNTGEIEAVTYNEFGVNAAMGTNWEVRG